MTIPARHANLLFAALMSLSMAFLMSALITLINRGAGSGYLTAWMQSFITAWPVAFVLVLVLAPLMRRLVARLTATG